jgi:NAD(P)-dependent dehydrogenase (short-subunit alcohol dehydrogenase family)
MDGKKDIIITGASSGIGAALTQSLAKQGYTLYVCARRESKLNLITCNNTIAIGYKCDVSDEEQVKAFISYIQKYTTNIYALINCAATFGAIGKMIQTESKDWRRAIDVNLFGTYYMIKHVVPMMSAGLKPRIINFSGGGAFEATPNYSAYAVSKAAVVRLTETIAKELASLDIAVNAVAPGFVATEIHEQTIQSGIDNAGREHFDFTLKKLSGDSIPIEIPVNCVNFLLSEKANGLTGKTISASFDPWSNPKFHKNISEINKSDLYTMRRINFINLPDKTLQSHLDDKDTEKNIK